MTLAGESPVRGPAAATRVARLHLIGYDDAQGGSGEEAMIKYAIPALRTIRQRMGRLRHAGRPRRRARAPR
ncbi:hypothetical protein F3J14_35815, partial [Burkholderia sp. Tr-862]|nr:hypothetical protein [Burkholderia sp. Tr-862]